MSLTISSLDKPDFVHLHVHSEYSMLDGIAKVKDLVSKAKEEGMKALALTDHGNMYGVVKFYKECKAQGIKPIIGCEVYATNDVYKEGEEPKKKTRDNYHLILLAKDNTGYHNLCRIVSSATEHMYYKPRATKEVLKKYHEGIIALTACIAGEASRAVESGGKETARKVLDEYVDIFGRDNLYVEVQKHGIRGENTYETLFELAEEMGLKPVLTNDIHYISREDEKAQEVVLCISSRTTIDDPKRFKMNTNQCYFKSAEEMYALFGNRGGCFSNTIEIAEKCNVEIEFKRNLAPKFPALPNRETETSYLRKLCEKSLPMKYKGDMLKKARERMDYELGIIEQMGYSGYFLIVWDFIRYARTHGILIGPGRGSGAGSIVCYLMDITKLEPLELDLLFERFLNPERVSMPDIDTDIADYGRDAVAEYMMDFYGRDKSAKIVTFQTMAAKAAVRNVAKVFGLPFSVGSYYAGLINTGESIDEALKRGEGLKKEYEGTLKAKKLIDMARHIENLPRQKGSHAAGIVISAVPLADALPISLEKDGHRTEYDKDEVEQLGLLKMDLLGLINLTIIRDTLKYVKERTGKDIDLEYATMPLDDGKTMEMLRGGHTFGVFQLESNGITELVKSLAPTCYKDLIPLVALYRPGPLGSGMVDQFIKCRRGEIAITYMHPWLEPILKETYGVILYQEQVMQIVQKLGDFTLGEADIMRRAMGHKEPELLMAQEEKFVNGCRENKIEESLARKIFDLMLQFASYGFNKSHSAAYAFVAYQTAYLKAHYPVEYMSAYMSQLLNKRDKLPAASMELKRMGIKLLPIDVNRSDRAFSPEGNSIRIGFSVIKGIGDTLTSSIMEEKAKGMFTEPSDFLGRVKATDKDFEALCQLGGFDSVYHEKERLCAFCHEIYDGVRTFTKKLEQNDKKQGKKDMFLSLFGGEELKAVELKVPSTNSFIPAEYHKRKAKSTRDITDFEKEYYGFYATKHPLDDYYESDIKGECTQVGKMKELLQKGKWKKNWIAEECGVIEHFDHRATKKGSDIAFAELETYEGVLKCVFFNSVYRRMQEGGIMRGKVFHLTGKPQLYNDSLELVVSDIKVLR